MYEREPRMPLHLGSRATRIADMAEALYWAIDESGLRLPPRRDIARHSRVSEATVSRRLRDSRTTEEERLTVRLVKARKNTYPPDYETAGWPRWIPETEQDLQDVRIWLSCLAQAAYRPAVSEAVLEAWAHEHRQVVCHLSPSALEDVTMEVETDAEVLWALLLGLAIRRALDPDLSRDHALMLLGRAVSALGPRDDDPRMHA